MTIDFGFIHETLCVGDMVFNDANNNGKLDSGEAGLAGIKVQLYSAGQQPGIDTPVGETITNSSGFYQLCTRTEGIYFIRIPASEFATGKPLANMLSSPGVGSDHGFDEATDENGIDNAAPATNGINSISFELYYGTEPLSNTSAGGTERSPAHLADVAKDANADLTFDFGFHLIPGQTQTLPPTISIGNVVYLDTNLNGIFDAGDPSIDQKA